MKSGSKMLIFLLFGSILLIGSCKKKKDDVTLPNNTVKEPTCVLSNSSYSSGSSSTNFSYSHNSDGWLSSSSITYSSITSTSNYSYTFDGNGNVIKRDEGSGTYIVYEYNSGKLSKYSEYSSSTLDEYSTYEYQTDKVIIKVYDNTSTLISMQEDNLSGNNVVSTKITNYYSSGQVSNVIQYSYSNFDDKYSARYLDRKSLVQTFTLSKNNPKNSTIITTYYNTSGVITSTDTGSISSVFTYNSNNAVTQEVQTYTNGSTTSTTTFTYTYSSCS